MQRSLAFGKANCSGCIPTTLISPTAESESLSNSWATSLPVRGEVDSKRLSVWSHPVAAQYELQEQLDQRASDDFVFTSMHGEPIRKSNFTRRYWKPAVSTTGFCWGCLSRTATHGGDDCDREAGAHPKALQLRMGHSSIMVTLDRYGHLMPGADEALADSIDELVAAHGRLSDDVVPLPTAGFG